MHSECALYYCRPEVVLDHHVPVRVRDLDSLKSVIYILSGYLNTHEVILTMTAVCMLVNRMNGILH